MQSTGTIIHTRSVTYFYFPQKQEEWVLTLPVQMWLSFMIRIGTRKTTFKLQLEHTESDKKVKSWCIDWSLAILIKLKCSKGPHKNSVLIKLYSWVVHLRKQVKQDHRCLRIRCLKTKWKYYWRRVYWDFCKMLNKMRRRKLRSFSIKMLMKLLKVTQESPNIQW